MKQRKRQRPDVEEMMMTNLFDALGVLDAAKFMAAMSATWEWFLDMGPFRNAQLVAGRIGPSVPRIRKMVAMGTLEEEDVVCIMGVTKVFELAAISRETEFEDGKGIEAGIDIAKILGPEGIDVDEDGPLETKH